MILGGLALAFSRLIDNSVVVLENIFRHLEMGESPEVAAEKGGKEVALPVIVGDVDGGDCVFPGHVSLWCEPVFIHGVGAGGHHFVVRIVFRGDDGGAACSARNLSRAAHGEHGAAHEGRRISARKFNMWFNTQFHRMLDKYGGYLKLSLLRPAATVIGILGVFVLSFGLAPFVGVSYFPKTDPGQFVINVKAPTGTRLENTEEYVKKIEQIIREEVSPDELDVIVSNIGVTPGFFVDVYEQLGPTHRNGAGEPQGKASKVGSYEYMARVRRRLQQGACRR